MIGKIGGGGESKGRTGIKVSIKPVRVIGGPREDEDEGEIEDGEGMSGAEKQSEALRLFLSAIGAKTDNIEKATTALQAFVNACGAESEGEDY